MGLRCLLGHDFGDVEVEREREEDGNEMVVTIRETKTCNRCGNERVVSENKEVTSIKTPEEAGIEDDRESAEPAAPEEPTHPAVEDETEAFEPPESADEDDAVILDEQEAEPQRQPGEWPDAERPESSTTPMQDEAGGPDGESAGDEAEGEPSAASTADHTEDAGAVEEEGAEPAPVESEAEDVEIIDDGPADGEPAEATGPESSAGGAESAADSGADGDGGAPTDQGDVESAADSPASEWPDHGGEDEGFDAEAGGGEGVSFSGNRLTPEVESDADGEDAEFIDADDAGTERAASPGSEEPSSERTEYAESEGDAAVEDTDGAHVSGPATESSGRNVGTDIARDESASIDLGPAEADTEYYCPNCGMTRNAGGSSMRAGDICPECRKGYITEQDT